MTEKKMTNLDTRTADLRQKEIIVRSPQGIRDDF